MEEASLDDYIPEHAVEEEWEFAAPQYYDFLNPDEDEQDADLWFGTPIMNLCFSILLFRLAN